MSEKQNATIETIDLVEMLRDSYVPYALEVIQDRALVSSRDGLKPVQRRILWSMNVERIFSNGPFRKVASISGSVLGDFHPHGQKAVEDALVRLGQDFTMRVPLMIAQGNWGSRDKDPAAAARYIEGKLSVAAELMLEDTIEQIVLFEPNYDQRLIEPKFLASKFPHILINGDSGIAVGMASCSPCHNPTEVCNAIKLFIKNPKATVDDLINIMPGPDWPSGGICFSGDGVKEYYTTGRGKVVIQGKATIDNSGNNPTIIITELPYQVGASDGSSGSKKISGLISEIVDLIKDEKSDLFEKEIVDIHDYSDNEKGIQIVIDLKSTSNPNLVLEELYKKTKLRINFNVNQTVLFDSKPQQASIFDIIFAYISHRREVVFKRCEFELKKAKEVCETLEAYLAALINIDEVIKIIRNKKFDVQTVKTKLCDLLKISQKQAEDILEIKLRRLSSMEESKIKEDYKNILKNIKDLESILSNPSKINDIINLELDEIIEKCGDDRKTVIINGGPKEIQVEDLIKETKICILINNDMTGKIVPRFSGGLSDKEKQSVVKMIDCKNTDYLMAITEQGKYVSAKLHSFELLTRRSYGEKLFSLDKDDKILDYFIVSEKDKRFLTLLTKSGKLKKTNISNYDLITRKPNPAIKLGANDIVLFALFEEEDKNDYLIISNNGYASRFSSDCISDTGRMTQGVNAFSAKAGSPVSFEKVSSGNQDQVLIFSEDTISKRKHGLATFGKRIKSEDISTAANKGGKGTPIIKKGHKVVATSVTTNEKDKLVITLKDNSIVNILAENVLLRGKLHEGDIIFDGEMSNGVKNVRRI